MKQKKFLALLVCAAMACALLVCAAGCGGPNNEQVIRDGISQELDSIKNKDEKVLKQIETNGKKAGLEKAGISSTDFANSALDGFDYSIGDITVDGNNATAQVTITSKSYSDLVSKLANLENDLRAQEDFESLTADQVTQRNGQLMMGYMDNLATVTETVPVEYRLQGNQWVAVKGSKAYANLDSIVFAQAGSTAAA